MQSTIHATHAGAAARARICFLIVGPGDRQQPAGARLSLASEQRQIHRRHLFAAPAQSDKIVERAGTSNRSSGRRLPPQFEPKDRRAPVFHWASRRV